MPTGDRRRACNAGVRGLASAWAARGQRYWIARSRRRAAQSLQDVSALECVVPGASEGILERVLAGAAKTQQDQLCVFQDLQGIVDRH
jgi:hypothetical protein